MSTPFTGLTAVIPALNECVTIGEVVSRAATVADRVIVVDDGSRDGTGEVAHAAGAHVIRHDAPRGYDCAIAEGLNAAFHLGAVAAVTLDADGQHRIEDVSRIAEPVMRGDVQFCGGVRDVYNRPIEALLGLIAGPLYGTRDPFCGLKCYHRQLFEQCGPFPTAMHVGTLPFAWIRRHRLPFRFLPIHVQRRADQPRFGSMVRASLKLAGAFLRTLRADLFYASSSRSA